MKKAKRGYRLFSFCFVLFVLFSSTSASIYASAAADNSAPVSLGLHVIAEDSSMAKAALVGSSIKFEADDFARALNVSKVDKITEADSQRQSENNTQGGLAVNNYLSDNAKHVKGDGNIAEGEGGDAAYGIGYGTYGGYAEIKTLDKYKANGHKNKAEQILGNSPFKVHSFTVSFCFVIGILQ